MHSDFCRYDDRPTLFLTEYAMPLHWSTHPKVTRLSPQQTNNHHMSDYLAHHDPSWTLYTVTSCRNTTRFTSTWVPVRPQWCTSHNQYTSKLSHSCYLYILSTHLIHTSLYDPPVTVHIPIIKHHITTIYTYHIPFSFPFIIVITESLNHYTCLSLAYLTWLNLTPPPKPTSPRNPTPTWNPQPLHQPVLHLDDFLGPIPQHPFNHRQTTHLVNIPPLPLLYSLILPLPNQHPNVTNTTFTNLN